MKAVILHGQSHQGISYHIGNELMNHLECSQINEFFLPKDMPHFCKGCYRCMQEGMGHCPHYGAMKPILTAFQECDLLVFTTPVYCMHTSGPMKAFLDHCFVYWTIHRPQAFMYQKKAVIISVGAGGGMKKAAKDIQDSLHGWGISEIYTIAQRGAAMSWQAVSNKTRSSIDKKIKKVGNHLRKHQGRHVVKLRQKMMFYAMRYMQKKGWGASEMDLQYWKESGYLYKKRPWL